MFRERRPALGASLGRSVCFLVAFLVIGGPAWANATDDARQALHEALETQAPVPEEPPSFPTPTPVRATPPGQIDRPGAVSKAARVEAIRKAAHAVRDAHMAAANRIATRSARDIAQAARADATSDAGQARSQEKRGVGNGKGKGKANGNGNGNGNN